MTKNRVLAAKGYCFRELFKLTVLNIIMNENVSFSTYIYPSAYVVNSMLISSRAQLNLQGKVMLSICHIQNKISQKKIGKTPYEL